MLGGAGGRAHAITQCAPVELFALEEALRLLPAPERRYDVPIYTTAKVHRVHRIEIAKALYSIPGNLIGERVDVRADRQLVRIYVRGPTGQDPPASAARPSLDGPERSA